MSILCRDRSHAFKLRSHGRHKRTQTKSESHLQLGLQTIQLRRRIAQTMRRPSHLRQQTRVLRMRQRRAPVHALQQSESSLGQNLLRLPSLLPVGRRQNRRQNYQANERQEQRRQLTNKAPHLPLPPPPPANDTARQGKVRVKSNLKKLRLERHRRH